MIRENAKFLFFFLFPIEKVKRDTIDLDKKRKSSGFVEFFLHRILAISKINSKMERSIEIKKLFPE